MGLRRGEARAFFAPGADNEEVLAERRRWIASDPEAYVAVLPEGEALIQETADFLRGLAVIRTSAAITDPLEQMKQLGGSVEPDLLLLRPDAEGRMTLQ